MATKKDDATASEEPSKVETAETMAKPGDEHDANKSTQETPDEIGDSGADFKLPHKMDLITIPGEKDDGSDTIQVSGRRWESLPATAAKKVREYAKLRRIQLRERPTQKES